MEDNVDLEGDGSGYSGTFRWKPSKKLNSLPSTTKNRKSMDYSNWMKYFVARSESDESAGALVQMVQSDLSIIDCLSTPLSICYLFEKSVFKGQPKTFFNRITIVCLGCSSKAEERVLRETNCFLELCYYFYNVQHIDLWLVGPEMSSTCEGFSSHKNIVKNQVLSCSIFQGTSSQFFRAFPSYLGCKGTVVVGFNCGFGNYENSASIRYNLLLSWLPDLYFLTGTNLPLLFTCANDYADLSGEIRVMLNVLGANVIIPPGENPFSYASTLVPPSSSGNSEFSRGNSFCYGVQGHTKSRRHKVNYSEGVRCIPHFLQLLGVSLPPLTAVSCTLELEVIEKKNKQTTGSASTTATAAVVASAVVEPTKVTEAALSSELCTPDVAALNISESAPVPAASDSCSKTETANAAVIVPSPSPLVVVPVKTKPYTVNQSVDGSRLTVTIAVDKSSDSSALVDLTQADLRISDDGRLLHCSLAEEAVDVIGLLAVVNHATMKAKYSKRHLTLTITADTKKS